MSLSRVGWRRVRGYRTVFSRRAHGRIPHGQPCRRAWPVEPPGLGRGRPQRAASPAPCCSASRCRLGCCRGRAALPSRPHCRHYSCRDATAAIVSLPYSRLLAASRYPPGPVGCRPHVAVHVVVTLLMALWHAGHGRSQMLVLIPSCLDVGPSATTAHVPPRRG